MPTTDPATLILLDLNQYDATRLYLEPSFNYDNPLQQKLNLFKFETGINKLKMLHLNKDTNMLQPKTSCKTWNPNLSLGLRPYEISTCDYEVNGEQCPDEFDDGCLRNLRAAPDELNRMSAAQNAIEMAMIMQLRQGLTDSVYKAAYFGNTGFQASVDAGEVDLSGLSPKAQSKLIGMLEICNGWWSEIIARTSDSGELTKVRYLDSNDGTGAGNAVNPANVRDFLKQMRISSHPMLQFWNFNKPINEMPVYMLQRGIFDALITYYQGLGTEIANQLIIDGVALPGTTTFEGYPVVMVPEWTMFDYETGNMNTTGDYAGYSKKQRALFTARENLCGVSNMSSLDGRPESALAIQVSPLLKDKGKKFIYAGLGFGFGVAQPVLMTASFNSSDTYV